MVTLQIEHPTANFDGWKKVFNSDPAGREKGGVVRYKISRKVEDPNYVIIDLDFDTLNEAEDFLSALRNFWGRVDGKVITNPQARIIEEVESKEY